MLLVLDNMVPDTCVERALTEKCVYSTRIRVTLKDASQAPTVDSFTTTRYDLCTRHFRFVQTCWSAIKP